ASGAAEALGSALLVAVELSMSTLTGVHTLVHFLLEGRFSLRPLLLEDRRAARDHSDETFVDTQRLVRRSSSGVQGVGPVTRPSQPPPSLLDIPPARNGPTRAHYPSACSLQKVHRAR